MWNLTHTSSPSLSFSPVFHPFSLYNKPILFSLSVLYLFFFLDLFVACYFVLFLFLSKLTSSKPSFGLEEPFSVLTAKDLSSQLFILKDQEKIDSSWFDPFNRKQTHRFPVPFWFPRLNRPCGERLDSGWNSAGRCLELVGSWRRGRGSVVLVRSPASYLWKWSMQLLCQLAMLDFRALWWRTAVHSGYVCVNTALTVYGSTCLDPFHIFREKVLLNTCNGSGFVPYSPLQLYWKPLFFSKSPASSKDSYSCVVLWLVQWPRFGSLAPAVYMVKVLPLFGVLDIQYSVYSTKSLIFNRQQQHNVSREKSRRAEQICTKGWKILHPVSVFLFVHVEV